MKDKKLNTDLTGTVGPGGYTGTRVAAGGVRGLGRRRLLLLRHRRDLQVLRLGRARHRIRLRLKRLERVGPPVLRQRHQQRRSGSSSSSSGTGSRIAPPEAGRAGRAGRSRRRRRASQYSNQWFAAPSPGVVFEEWSNDGMTMDQCSGWCEDQAKTKARSPAPAKPPPRPSLAPSPSPPSPPSAPVPPIRSARSAPPSSTASPFLRLPCHRPDDAGGAQF